MLYEVFNATFTMLLAWAITYYALYERQRENNIYVGLMWYLLYVFCIALMGGLNYTYLFSVLLSILITFYDNVPKFDNGYHKIYKTNK